MADALHWALVYCKTFILHAHSHMSTHMPDLVLSPPIIFFQVPDDLAKSFATTEKSLYTQTLGHFCFYIRKRTRYITQNVAN